METVADWAKQYEPSFAILAHVFVVIGIAAVFITWRSMMTNTAAALSSRMFEINRLEIERPQYFIALGDHRSIVPQSVDKLRRTQEVVALRYFETAIARLKSEGEKNEEVKTSIQDEMCKWFQEALRCSCVNNYGERSVEQAMREVSHYLFILFSFYEQVFIIRRCFLGCYRLPWQKRFVEHMKKRPLFRMYWYTVYRHQCTPKFCRIVRRIEKEGSLWFRVEKDDHGTSPDRVPVPPAPTVDSDMHVNSNAPRESSPTIVDRGGPPV